MLAGLVLCGCSQTREEEKLHIVCTIYPQYDWVRQILGDKIDTVEVTLLLDDTIDLHSYQPTVGDIAKISDCDLFIYGGGASDEWADDVLKEAANPDIKVIHMLEALGQETKTEELVEGMEEEKNQDGEEEGLEYDEHVWLSLKNAQVLCTSIAEALYVLDTENAQIYKDNLKIYIEEIAALDAGYQETIINAPVKTLLFGDRFPFRYLMDDYELEYYAAFPGCSAETEASFDTIVFLSEKMDELNLKNIMVTESSDSSMAKTIRDNTKSKNQEILVLDGMQSISVEEVEEGITYLSIMEKNLGILEKALQ
jgi:zinc transport system substrate-binding protein